MTRNEIDNEIAYCNQVEGAIINGYCCETVDNLLDRIINEHETAIEILMKANEEEISRHFNECEKYEAQLKEVKFAITVLNKNLELNSELLKAKDEEIERLKAQSSSVHNLMYRNGYSDAIDCYDTFGKFNTKHKPNAKSRSIIAMLFWNMKAQQRKYKNTPDIDLVEARAEGSAGEATYCFQKSYKILKEQQ